MDFTVPREFTVVCNEYFNFTQSIEQNRFEIGLNSISKIAWNLGIFEKNSVGDLIHVIRIRYYNI